MVLTALKLLPLLLFGIIALWFVDAGNYIPFNPSGESLPKVAHVTVILTMWALCGLEVATVPAGSIRDAKRTIPRATMLGTLLVLGGLAWAQWGAMLCKCKFGAIGDST